MNQIATIAPAMQRTSGSGRIMVKAVGAHTRLDRFYQEGAAKIRIPRLPGRTGMEAVLINTAGGLTGGDRLSWDVQAGPGTALTMTTQACEKVYKAAGGTAQIDVALAAGDGASLAWLPQETILFDRARLVRRLEADLAPDARLLAVEATIFGRQAHGESVREALFADRWRIRRAGRLIHADDLRLSGDVAATLALPAVTGGGIAVATVLLASEDAEALLERLRALLAACPHVQAGASFWPTAGSGKLLARLVASDGISLRKGLSPALALLNQGAPLPKIWSL
ncbi:urease accessory protein UreD [Zhengella sp. ZM62]|uniref:urease accessory protein UreD n=1 Tax=Zhengella sedimenti TaxID=3390035 RepID=UPI0039769918